MSEHDESERLNHDGTNAENLQIGDVVLDLAQGRPMQIVDRYDGNAADWSEEKDYDLVGNYGNGRLGATEHDAVFSCVYCSSIKSEPSKTYDFPESRLARVEVDHAEEDLERIQYEIRQRFLVDLLVAGYGHEDLPGEAHEAIVEVASVVAEPRLASEAEELAAIEIEASRQSTLSDGGESDE